MARRGKVKYKDVVKKPHLTQKKNPKKSKQRKTYSLHQKDGGKRKFVAKSSYEPKIKQSKFEETIQEKNEPSTDEEEDEEVADLDNLLGTFKNNNSKKLEAIESSSESESEPDDDLIEEEEDNDSIIDEEEDIDDNNSIASNENNEIDLDNDNDLVDVINPQEDDLSQIDDKLDPYNKHISYDLHDTMLDSLQSTPLSVNNVTETWPKLGALKIQIPKCDATVTENNEFTIAEKKIYAPQGVVPKIIKSTNYNNLHIKPQIINNLIKVNKNINDSEYFTHLQDELFSIINNYQDLYYPERNYNNAEEIRFVYCLHAVNHILKNRLKVIHHNAKLTKKDDVPEEFRDQGLVRPKVLIVVPFKNAAYKTVRMLTNIILPEDKGNVMNKLRFEEEYTGNEIFLPKKNPKPEDYEKTFEGNTSDDFRIGMTVTKKSIKLYADFYKSDVIIASPLGLRTIIGAEGEADRDYDFLASIEVLIMDQTEIFLMQNWDHVLHMFNHIHLQPKDSHGTDFSRVRTWSLNGWAKYYRQTLLFSSLNLPEINAIFNKKCLNYAGKIRVLNTIKFGCIGQVVVQIPHVFQKFDSKCAADAIEDRFDFFIHKVLPQQRESLMKQTLIFVPSYFDYVRLRNYFKKEDISFVQICEYSKEAKIARARDMFYHGDAHFLLYTERFHFFHRKRIKGIRHIVFYQLPMFPHFYYEMCNLMQEANLNRKLGSGSNMTVTVLYSKYDIYQLSAVVGSEKGAKMVQSDRNIHMMVTGS